MSSSTLKKYGEFRLLTEFLGRGKFRIRPEFIPSLAAYFVMIGKVYERGIQGMRARTMIDTVPGHAEAIVALERCQSHLQRLLSNLTTNFAADDWQAAVIEIAELMGIEPESQPPAEFTQDAFDEILAPVTPDARDTAGTGPDVQPRAERGAGESGQGGSAGTGPDRSAESDVRPPKTRKHRDKGRHTSRAKPR